MKLEERDIISKINNMGAGISKFNPVMLTVQGNGNISKPYESFYS